MKSEVTEVATCRYKLNVEVTAEEVNKEFDKALDSIKDRVVIKGFRRGHAPKRVMMRRYGEDIASDVKSQMFQDTFTNALKEKELAPLGEPEVDYAAIEVKPGAPFSYTAEVDVRPKFDLPEYKGIKLTENIEVVTDEAVQERIENLAKGFAVYNEVSDGFVKGDAMSADAVMAEGANEIMKREDMRIPAESNRLMGLEVADLQEQIVGMKVGDTKEFKLDVPEEYYQKDAAGKSVVITITVKKVERPEYPAIDDELAKRVGLESFDVLKQRVKDSMENENKQKARAELEKEVLDELLGKVSFDLPEQHIKHQVEQQVGRRKSMFESMGDKKPADADEQIAKLEKEAREEAETMTRRMVVLDTIADKEEIEIGQEDIWRHIQMMAQQYGMQPEQMLKQIQQMNAMMYIVQEVRQLKVVDFLVENAEVTTQESA